MNRVVIEFDLDNTMFDDSIIHGAAGDGIAHVLRHLAGQVDERALEDITSETIYDVNGNRIGQFSIRREEG